VTGVRSMLWGCTVHSDCISSIALLHCFGWLFPEQAEAAAVAAEGHAEQLV
jgi:hypothetical protein